MPGRPAVSAPTDPRDPQELAGLRLRLYQPSASEDDVERYRAAIAELPAPPPPPIVAVPAGRAVGRRVVIVAAATSAAALIGAVVATSDRGAVRRAPSNGIMTATDLDAPRDLIADVTGYGQSFSGTGPGTVPIDRSTLSFRAGRVRVAMTSSAAGGAEWRIDRVETRSDWSSYQRTLARGHAVAPTAPPAPLIFEYVGAPPTTAHVQAAEGARWTLDLRFVMR